MRHKDKDDTPKSPEQEALERQVDAMMDPKRPDGPPAAIPVKQPEKPPANEKKAPPSGSPAPVNKTNAATTAPELSAQLRKELGISEADTKPISIGELDDLAKKISVGRTEDVEDDKIDVKVVKTADAKGPVAADGPVKITKQPEAKDDSPVEDPTEQSTELDDARTDEAVDDIVRHEGDVMLALADATAAERSREAEESSGGEGGHHVFSTVLWSLVFIIVVAAVLLLILFVTGGNVTGLHLGTS